MARECVGKRLFHHQIGLEVHSAVKKMPKLLSA